jgi:hypothetical protein
VAIGQGIVTASKGGVKDVSGGIAESLAAIAPLTGPAAPFIGATAAVAGLVSAFTPSGQTARANAIAKTIFTQTYLAPQAMNVTQGSNGGYSDFNTAGGVRTSDFSPYPIISQSYADVPRRVDVPGHTLSPFGGYQTVTGAKTPSAPTYHVTINALDSKSIVDRSGDIVDAFHVGIQSGFHPVVNSLAGQLGLRG